MKKKGFKKVLEFVQSNYRSRLFQMYILNSPSSITIPWRMVKTFLDEVTINKIKIVKGSSSPEMFTHINKSQLEKRFGGNCENLTTSSWLFLSVFLKEIWKGLQNSLKDLFSSTRNPNQPFSQSRNTNLSLKPVS